MDYIFDWDPSKAMRNRRHGIAFEAATTIFADPSALSIGDDDHGGDEESWITLGLDASGNLLTMVHTFAVAGVGTCEIRLIPALEATKKATKQYESEE